MLSDSGSDVALGSVYEEFDISRNQRDTEIRKIWSVGFKVKLVEQVGSGTLSPVAASV